MNYKRTVCLSFLVIVSLVAGCSVSNRTETGNNIPISTVPGEVETTNTPPFTSTVGPTETQFSALRTELTVTPYIQKSIDQSMIPQCSGGGDIVPKPVGFGLSGAMILMDWNKNGFSLIGGNPLEQSEFISTGEDYPQLFGFSTNGEWLGYAINTPDKDNSITIYLLSASGETITNELDLSSYLSEIPPENKFLGLSGFSYWINNKLVYISLYSTINDGKPGLVTYLGLMLIRKSQGFDMKEIWLTQQAVDVNTQRMSGQLTVQAGTQSPKSMGVVLLNRELPGQLAVDRLDQLSDGIVQMLESRRNLLFLVYSRNGAQRDTIFLPQFRRDRCTNIALVAQHLLVGMFTQQLKSSFQIGSVSGGQFEVQDQTAHGDQQMQSIAKESLLFRDRFAVGGIKGFPIRARRGNQMKLQRRDRHTINQALIILAQIQTMHDHLSDQVDRLHQIPSSPIEPALRRNTRKQVPVFFPTAQQFRFHMPAATFSDQSHRNQLAIPAFRFRPGPFEERSNLFPGIIHHDKYPGAKILKVRYHQGVLRLARLSCGDPFLTMSEDFSSIILN